MPDGHLISHVKLTQSMLLQKLAEEYLTNQGTPKFLAAPRQILV